MKTPLISVLFLMILSSCITTTHLHYSDPNYLGSDEFSTYEEIAANGGGILSSITNVRNSSEEQLFDESLKYSNLNEALLTFKDGIDTIIGEVGNKVSGGQGQRIGLARAFFHKKDVMVFDEATSSLDSDLEHKVYEYIVSTKGNNTSIIITHNPNIIKLCSKSYKL